MVSHLAKLVTAASLMICLLASTLPPTHASAAAQLAGTRSTFGDSQECPSPPVGFDPLTASDATLLYYGLPRRPEQPGGALEHWKEMVVHAKHRGCTDHPASPRSIPAHDGHSHNSAQLGWYWANGGNWAGWEVNSGTFQYAFADWTIPTVNTSQSPWNSDVADWVGIGGDPGYLWQAGTWWKPVDRSWVAFWENWPTSNPNVLSPVSAGDQMAAQVDYGQTYAGQSYFYLSDYTTGQYWPRNISWQPSTGTAEWIDESSYCSTGYPRQMASFSNIPWSYAWAGATIGDTHPISYFPSEARHYSLIDSTLRAEPGPLSADGHSFTEYWYANGPNNC